jgi:hypothetical protein
MVENTTTTIINTNVKPKKDMGFFIFAIVSGIISLILLFMYLYGWKIVMNLWTHKNI